MCIIVPHDNVMYKVEIIKDYSALNERGFDEALVNSTQKS